MSGRGLRRDIRQATYDHLLDCKPIGDRSALRDARGPAAETVFEHEQREARKVCRIFVTAGAAVTACERCGFSYAEHRAAWRAS